MIHSRGMRCGNALGAKRARQWKVRGNNGEQRKRTRRSTCVVCTLRRFPSSQAFPPREKSSGCYVTIDPVSARCSNPMARRFLSQLLLEEAAPRCCCCLFCFLLLLHSWREVRQLFIDLSNFYSTFTHAVAAPPVALTSPLPRVCGSSNGNVETVLFVTRNFILTCASADGGFLLLNVDFFIVFGLLFLMACGREANFLSRVAVWRLAALSCVNVWNIGVRASFLNSRVISL